MMQILMMLVDVCRIFDEIVVVVNFIDDDNVVNEGDTCKIFTDVAEASM